MPDFVQGFLATITIDATNTTPITVTASLTRSKTALEKSVMDGTGQAASIPGMASGELAFEGHISQAELNVLEVSFAKTVPIAFILEINEGLTTDGQWTGNFVFTELSVETSPDGNWAFTASGPIDGAVTFTPSVA